MVTVSMARSLESGSLPQRFNSAFTKYRSLSEGKNADYIPALAKVDPSLFGIALITPDGRVFTAGDTTTEVSIQSISKVFTLARVMQDSGDAAIVKNTGVDATGMAFNIEADTSELAQWVLMPKGYQYKDYHYVYYKKDQPETAIQGKFFTQYLADDSMVLAFKLLSLDPGYEHEIIWNYVKQ